ncbi:hypothetical protein CEUSTIGMA_g483.t1 [Chlamydomonas eustigma]|uniref:Protein kinase domain-containing protein n=1 Tax=Chlamydomonas eustigma TaxID=1157962 RepID=A0A250WQF8_9CHLO|nr:hypothetical protein CEUSTIGMA_g483.t1 [Chlamydomonas eustigma]|eukprot:GAX73031.1 hypothetical protein CEUSTIGMA_g483.t1 [Chlamydomonas eustigma]
MHTNKVYQGTLTQMAPEIFQGGRVGKATDLYAFGILLWELYIARYSFYGIDRISLPYLVCSQCLRPKWPFSVPKRYAELAEQCWSENSDERPSFHSILSILTQMREVNKEIEDATQQNGLGLQVMWDSSGVINLLGGSED